MQSETCEDWRKASVEERLSTVSLLRGVVAGPQDQGRTLPDEEAYDLFERACNSRPGRTLLLYEIYIRAAAFQSFR